MFQGVEKDHLATDQGPLPRPHIAQLDERVPQRHVVAWQRR